MMMVEMSSVPSNLLPVTELTDHLRLASGFADDGSQDAQLESCLRAALAAIEARIGKALYQRGFLWQLHGWQSGDMQALPLAPVQSVTALRVISRGGDVTIADPATYELKKDTHRPSIVAVAGDLPRPVQGGSIELELLAGYGATWQAIPADLRQAVLIHAASLYENRGDGGPGIPCSVAVLIEPYRPVRLRGVGL